MKEKKAYKHPLAVSHTESESGAYSEYDKHGRAVYTLTSFGFWSMKFYVDEEYVTTPYFVIHKYSVLYNTLPFYNPEIASKHKKWWHFIPNWYKRVSSRYLQVRVLFKWFNK